MTAARKRRWPRFSLRELLGLTALVAALCWAALQTHTANQFRADAEKLRSEKASLASKVETQEKIVSTFKEALKNRRPPPPGSISDHWLPPIELRERSTR